MRKRSLINHRFVLMIWERIRICLIASIAVRIFLHFIVKIAERTRFASHLNLLRLFSISSVSFLRHFPVVHFFSVYYSDTFALHITTSEDYRQNTKMFVWKPVSRTKERVKKKRTNERTTDSSTFKCIKWSQLLAKFLLNFYTFCPVYLRFHVVFVSTTIKNGLTFVLLMIRSKRKN